VARFVKGGEPFFLFGHDQRPPFGAHHDLIARILELLTRDHALPAPSGEQRRFVNQIHEIRARKARRSARDHFEVDVWPERDFAHMDLQDLLAADEVRV
jgi:hypothetical protein